MGVVAEQCILPDRPLPACVREREREKERDRRHLMNHNWLVSTYYSHLLTWIQCDSNRPSLSVHIVHFNPVSPSYIRCLQWCIRPSQKFLCLVYFSCSPCTCVYPNLKFSFFCSSVTVAFVLNCGEFCVFLCNLLLQLEERCALVLWPNPHPTPPSIHPSLPTPPPSQRGSFPLMHLL